MTKNNKANYIIYCSCLLGAAWAFSIAGKELNTGFITCIGAGSALLSSAINAIIAVNVD